MASAQSSSGLTINSGDAVSGNANSFMQNLFLGALAIAAFVIGWKLFKPKKGKK